MRLIEDSRDSDYQRQEVAAIQEKAQEEKAEAALSQVNAFAAFVMQSVTDEEEYASNAPIRAASLLQATDAYLNGHPRFFKRSCAPVLPAALEMWKEYYDFQLSTFDPECEHYHPTNWDKFDGETIAFVLADFAIWMVYYDPAE